MTRAWDRDGRALHEAGKSKETATYTAELQRQLVRANRIIGWMLPYIGSMCPPPNGLSDLNFHCCENVIPEPGEETHGSPLKQHRIPNVV